jgi:hypothetical protein
MAADHQGRWHQGGIDDRRRLASRTSPDAIGHEEPKVPVRAGARTTPMARTAARARHDRNWYVVCPQFERPTAWLRTQSRRTWSGGFDFPANREFNREFFKFGPFSAIHA